MEKIISKNVITAIPGIGVTYAKRLDAVGIKKPRDLLKQFEKLDRDPLLFVHWMKTQCQAKAGHARKIFDVVKSFNEKRICKEKEMPKRAISLETIAKNAQPSTPKSATLITSQSTPHSTGGPDCKALVCTDHDEKYNSNHHIINLREQFKVMYDMANKKMLELQSELSKMQYMTHEFDILAEILSSDEKMSMFEQNLDRFQKMVYLTEEKLQEINKNNHKMGQMIREIAITSQMQHESNEKAMNEIGERIIRWESKLDRVTRQQKMESILNGRLDELIANVEWMKTVIFGILALIILKTVLFDLAFQEKQHRDHQNGYLD